MSNDELDRITLEIRDGATIAYAQKLLRSIEISALREALGLVQENFVRGIDYLRITHIKADAITALETKIRDLELK